MQKRNLQNEAKEWCGMQGSRHVHADWAEQPHTGDVSRLATASVCNFKTFSNFKTEFDCYILLHLRVQNGERVLPNQASMKTNKKI